MVCKRLSSALLLALASVAPTISQDATVSVTLEFEGAPIADMLVGLGRAAGVSIVPDETVTGTASYFFQDIGFEEAIAEFAARFKLFVTEENGIYTVSALQIDAGDDGRLTVSAPTIEIGRLLDRLSRATRTPILFERLPTRVVSYYGENLSLEGILAQIATQLPDHSLERTAGAFVFAYHDTTPLPARTDWVSVTGDLYSISSAPARMPDLLRILFDAAGHEYQLLSRSEPTIGPLDFARKSFDELLRLVLERGGAAFSVFEDVYYVVDAPPQAAAARALVTEVVVLESMAVSSLLDLLPPEQIVDVTIRQERVAGIMTVTGTRASVARVLPLIRLLDASPRSAVVRHIELSSIAADSVAGYLPSELRSVRIFPRRDSPGITVIGTTEQLDSLERLIEAIDVPEPTRLVILDHLAVTDLLAHLPRSGEASRIVPTTDPHRFFYVGSSAAYARFMRDIGQIDRPRPQIGYHLLVVQYQEGEGVEFNLDLSNSLTSPDGVQALVGSIGNLLSLDFDIISSFGYQFAARLDASLSNSTASLVADTTLSGLSGEPVSFRNTSTYRYRDVAIDPLTGEQGATGVVREITSGLILEISGSSSGDTVTMDVAATVSRRGTDASGSGNPPPTSEKVVRTRVRAESGSPVVIGGLRLQEEETSIRETPILGKIPLLGYLFQGRREHSDSTELAIYIVPRIEPEPAPPIETELLRLYDRYFGASE